MTEAQWDEVISANLKSVFNLTKAIQRPMLKAKKGSIINMSSVVGIEGNAGQSNYAASKAGIIGFTKSVGQELGSRNIRSNAVAPGFIETEMTAALDPKIKEGWIQDIPLKRTGTAEDVANLVAFLASDNSSYITGQVVSICGGMHTYDLLNQKRQEQYERSFVVSLSVDLTRIFSISFVFSYKFLFAGP
jgi:3-oxoacyl-[acyl-carrier protein] reductase